MYMLMVCAQVHVCGHTHAHEVGTGLEVNQGGPGEKTRDECDQNILHAYMKFSKNKKKN